MELSDIEKLAKLSRITISQEEKKGLLSDLKSILGYVGEIQKASVGERIPEAGALRNVMREDNEYSEKLATPEEILNEVPEREGNYVKVKQVFS